MKGKTHILKQKDADLWWAGDYWTEHRPAAHRYTWADCMETCAALMEGERMIVKPELWRTRR